MKINFLYFADSEGNHQTNVAYMPGFYWNDFLDDYVIKCEIIKNQVKLSVVPEEWMDKKEITQINKELKYGIQDSWEFLTFYSTPEDVLLPLKDDAKLELYSDKTSKSFNLIYSTQNMKNMQKNLKKINKI